MVSWERCLHDEWQDAPRHVAEHVLDYRARGKLPMLEVNVQEVVAEAIGELQFRVSQSLVGRV